MTDSEQRPAPGPMRAPSRQGMLMSDTVNKVKAVTNFTSFAEFMKKLEVVRTNVDAFLKDVDERKITVQMGLLDSCLGLQRDFDTMLRLKNMELASTYSTLDYACVISKVENLRKQVDKCWSDLVGAFNKIREMKKTEYGSKVSIKRMAMENRYAKAKESVERLGRSIAAATWKSGSITDSINTLKGYTTKCERLCNVMREWKTAVENEDPSFRSFFSSQIGQFETDLLRLLQEKTTFSNTISYLERIDPDVFEEQMNICLTSYDSFSTSHDAWNELLFNEGDLTTVDGELETQTRTFSEAYQKLQMMSHQSLRDLMFGLVDVRHLNESMGIQMIKVRRLQKEKVDYITKKEEFDRDWLAAEEYMKDIDTRSTLKINKLKEVEDSSAGVIPTLRLQRDRFPIACTNLENLFDTFVGTGGICEDDILWTRVQQMFCTILKYGHANWTWIGFLELELFYENLYPFDQEIKDNRVEIVRKQVDSVLTLALINTNFPAMSTTTIDILKTELRILEVSAESIPLYVPILYRIRHSHYTSKEFVLMLLDVYGINRSIPIVTHKILKDSLRECQQAADAISRFLLKDEHIQVSKLIKRIFKTSLPWLLDG